MSMIALMSVLYLHTNNSCYYEPLKQTFQATYKNSELEQHTNEFIVYSKNALPKQFGVAPIVYTLLIKKEFKYRNIYLNYDNNATFIKYTFSL